MEGTHVNVSLIDRRPSVVDRISASLRGGWASRYLAVGCGAVLRQKMFQESESDYLELFKPDSSWSKTAQLTQVFLTNGGLILRESDATLQVVFADLKRRHIALAIEAGVLSGKGPDGHTQEASSTNVANSASRSQ